MTSPSSMKATRILIWDFMHGNVLLGRSVQGRDILYVRDMDKGDMRGRFEGDRYIPFQPSTWHALNITMDYHIPKSQAQMQAAWDMQMMLECRRLRLRVIHGIRFRNAVFMRDNFDPDHFDKPISRIVKRGPEYDKFNWPYELTLTTTTPEVSMQARKFLEFVTEPDGRTLMDGTPGDASHSADNLTRYFATPSEEYKHLTYVLYGGGGNGKGITSRVVHHDPRIGERHVREHRQHETAGWQTGAGGFLHRSGSVEAQDRTMGVRRGSRRHHLAADDEPQTHHLHRRHAHRTPYPRERGGHMAQGRVRDMHEQPPSSRP